MRGLYRVNQRADKEGITPMRQLCRKESVFVVTKTNVEFHPLRPLIHISFVTSRIGVYR